MIGNDNLGWGSFGDAQVPFSYNHYSDTAMEILLVRMKSVIESKIKKKLFQHILIQEYINMEIY